MEGKVVRQVDVWSEKEGDGRPGPTVHTNLSTRVHLTPTISPDSLQTYQTYQKNMYVLPY